MVDAAKEQAKIYLTYPFGDEIKEIVPLEDPRNDFGRIVWTEGCCRTTSTGNMEGVHWHATRALARVRHMRNLKNRIHKSAEELASLTNLLVRFASESVDCDD
jgi:hypothetical protein